MISKISGKVTYIEMKFYVVFKGKTPGIYESWDETRDQVEGFPGAIYKGYQTSAEATMAFRKAQAAEDNAELRRLIFGATKHRQKDVKEVQDLSACPEIDGDAWAVDAACSGNPGKMEYRGVDLKTGKIVFKAGPFEDATNNIGEFLAIVHAMALMSQKGEFHNIYSDSRTGMSWVRNKMVKTQLKPTAKNRKTFELMARASTWLKTHVFPCRVLKWETDQWGEIPADFGRK